MELTREQVEAAYDLGKDAVVTLVLSLAEQVGAQAGQLAAQAEEIAQLKERLGKNSRNSHKPPSSDGLRRRTVSNRERSGRPSGGQIGHPGKTLMQVASPDVVEQHHPVVCGGCQQTLTGVDGMIASRRQVFDLPAKLYEVTEHQVMAVVCPHCQTSTRGAFPEGVSQPTQYGSRAKGAMVYMQGYQFLTDRRTKEFFRDVIGLNPSEGTIKQAQRSCAAGLREVTAAIKASISRASVVGADETGVRTLKETRWLHTARTDFLTHLQIHAKRGRDAMDAIGVLVDFMGTLVHDGLASYFQYGSRHALCNAHLLRELKAIANATDQAWAGQMRGLLVEIKTAVEVATAQEAAELEPDSLSDFTKRYQNLIAIGQAANPLPVQTKARGRLKRTLAGNLVKRMDDHSEAVLLFMHDFTVPFDNNGSERDLRMMKVKLKISGCFRSEYGADDFCSVRGYISTLRKQRLPVLDALTSVFDGAPIVPDLS
jgi:transposase